VPEASGVLTRAEYRRLLAEQSSVTAAQEPVPVEPDASSLVEAVALVAVMEAVAEAAAHADDARVARPSLRRSRRAALEQMAEPLVAEEILVEVPESTESPERPGSAESPESTPAADLPAASAFSASDPDPSCSFDEFEFAARLFSFTGQTPVQRSAVPTQEASAPVSHLVPRRARSVVGTRIAAASFSIGVMTIVGMLAVGITTPAAAIGATPADITVASGSTVAADHQIQAFVSSSAASDVALNRPETYDVASIADIAAASGVTQFAGTWVSDPDAAIQWPFPVGVPISAAYGSTDYLSEFSTPHHGVDLTPGAGAEIHVIADGTVRIATEAGGDYGVTVVVDHVIDGALVSTRYGHMQYGSLTVSQGDTVKAGDVIGKVGQTGKATGPHLHFEVLLNGTTHTDPMAWMYAHTKG